MKNHNLDLMSVFWVSLDFKSEKWMGSGDDDVTPLHHEKLLFGWKIFWSESADFFRLFLDFKLGAFLTKISTWNIPSFSAFCRLFLMRFWSEFFIFNCNLHCGPENWFFGQKFFFFENGFSSLFLVEFDKFFKTLLC